VKPPPFEYEAPATLDEALGLLARHGEEARVLAGGQSLVPLLALRLARPDRLVDLNRVPGLAYVEEAGEELRIGAMTRQAAVERSAVVGRRCPLLREAVRLIGHPAIRTRGTVGGSLAHADPAAELPAAVAALGGTLVVAGPGGRRAVPAGDFFRALFTTALGPADVLVEVRLPAAPPRTGAAFREVSRRAGDFALAGAAAVVGLDGDGRCARVSVALAGVDATPTVVAEAPALLVGTRLGPREVDEVCARLGARLAPPADVHASAEYRRHLAGVLVRRALGAALARAREAA
jgi:carbon-monoxide dehydrogenase medium subunit